VPDENTDLVDGVPELVNTSESEQMYLITAARAEEDGLRGHMPMGVLASTLGVTVTSANEMVRKLAVKGLLEYVPYRGVALTADGRLIAGRVLRTRRLWSTFLAAHLDFSATEADDLACHLEHVTPPDAAERLAAFLGDPLTGPLGKPIPRGGGAASSPDDLPLTSARVGETVEVASIAVTKGVRSFLAAEGVAPGAPVTVQASGASGMLIDVEGHQIHLGTAIALGITVRGSHVA